MNYKQIALFAVSYRFLIFVLLLFFPFNHVVFGNITPLSFQGFADYNFFSNFGESKFKLENFISNYINILTIQFDLINNRFPGPLFSIIIFITNYSSEYPYLMAIVIFFCELLASLLWAKYIYSKLGTLSSILFCSMPIPLIFGFLHSSDAVFYFLSSIFILSFKNYLLFKESTKILLLILLIFTRPTGILFVMLYLGYTFKKKKNYNFIFTLVLLFIAVFYYFPYFIYEFNVLSSISFYEMYVLDRIGYEVEKSNLELIIQYIKKFFLLFGFVKSESGNIYFYLLRCVCASVFILGYLYCFYKKNLTDIIINNLFVLTILFFFFPAYRYILPIVPLLCLYFFTFAFDFYKYFNKN